MQAPATALRPARKEGIPEPSLAFRLGAAALPPKTPHAPVRSGTILAADLAKPEKELTCQSRTRPYADQIQRMLWRFVEVLTKGLEHPSRLEQADCLGGG